MKHIAYKIGLPGWKTCSSTPATLYSFSLNTIHLLMI